MCTSVSGGDTSAEKKVQKQQQQQQHAVAGAHGGQREAATKKNGQKKAIKQKKTNAKKTNAKKANKKKANEKKASRKLAVQGSGRQAGCLASNCLDLAVSYIGLLRTKVTNYQKQVTRLGKLNSTASGKAGKQNAFASTRNQLINQGGGNATLLTCGTSTNNTGRTIENILTPIEDKSAKLFYMVGQMRVGKIGKISHGCIMCIHFLFNNDSVKF